MKYIMTLVGLLCVLFQSQAQNVVSAEYWIDTDPGFGKGTAVKSFSADTTVQLNLKISQSLQPGIHWIGFRTKDSKNNWSLDNVFSFEVQPNIERNPLVQVEYWVDTDPGFGKATQWAGIHPEEQSDSFFSVVSSKLAPGHHQIGIRSMDSMGLWSHTNTFQVEVKDTTQTPVNALEYYWDEDPGLGRATLVEFDSAFEDFQQSNFELYTPKNLTLGKHQLFVRTRNTLQQWSHTNIVGTIEVIKLSKDSIIVDSTVCNQFVTGGGLILSKDTQVLEVRLVSGPLYQQYFYKIRIPELDAGVVKLDTSITTKGVHENYQWLRCDENYETIIMGDSREFVPNQPGSFAVEIMDEGCKDTSICIDVPVSMNSIQIADTSCSPYQTILGHTVFSDSQFYEYKLKTGLIFQEYYYNLTIPQLDVKVVQNNNELSTIDTYDEYQWFTCNPILNEISGATNQALTLSTTGDYLVEVTKVGCKDTSECSMYQFVSVPIHDQLGINVYPNPTNGFLSIELSEELLNSELQIVDLVGNGVVSEMSHAVSTNLNLTFLSPGTYFLHINKPSYHFVQKIIIQP